MTSETNALNGTPVERVTVQSIILDMIVAWHEDNAAACTSARQQSLQWALTSTGEDKLLIRDEYVRQHEPEIVRLAGYQLSEPLPQHLIDLHGIVVDEDGFVSMQQEARLIIPQVMDPYAMDRQVEAVRVPRTSPGPLPPRTPLPNRPLVGYRVRTGGRTRDVIKAKMKINGRLRDILIPG